MKFAIISDIHSNLEALTKALDTIKKEGVDEILFLGDVVGYGANPNECVDLVREHCSVILLGNHDLAAVDLSVAEFFTSNARTAAHWTSEQLSPKNTDFLKRLPYTAVADGARLVHSSPDQPEEWHYIISESDARRMFPYFKEAICFVGHSHVPGVFCESSFTEEVRRGERFIVNVGSIGQPRDGNPKLSFGVFDSSRWEYKNIRLEYDCETAARKIREAGLPRMLADRLFQGV
jgi:diadenosine tetraphosphatase ApaH/serine/threonine PP2A family protein phosphatase